MPPPAAWLARIESAHSVAELIRTLRDYLASLSAEEIAQLPKGVSGASLAGAADIQEWAVMLAHHDLRGDPDAQALHRSAVVFAAAGAKIPKLAG